MSKSTVVVFSGAGLSIESGIPTYRADDGLWANHRIEEVATHTAWRKNSAKMIQFYADRMEQIGSVQPNAAHLAIAKLEETHEVINVTQNIDDLLERAGCSDVRHLHGSINSRKCSKHSDIIRESRNFQCDYKAPQTEPVRLGDLCPKCGSQLRPDIVWFEEAVHFTRNKIMKLVYKVNQTNGIFICVGTSAQVYPAATFLPCFENVRKKYIIDPASNSYSNYTHLKGKAGEILPTLVKEFQSE